MSANPSAQAAVFPFASDPGRLRRRVLETYAGVPAYRQLWQRSDIDPAKLDFPREFARLPVVTKNDFLQFEFKDRCLGDPNNPRMSVERTSGSTGQPFATLINPKVRRRRQVRFLRALLHSGYRPGSRLMFLSTRDDIRHARFLNWRYVPITLAEHELAAAYRSFKPSVVYGPLNTLLTLARGLQNGDDDHPRPRSVITTAEQQNQLARQQLQQCFGVAPADFYGLTETGLIAWRPGSQKHFRLATSDLFIEYLPLSSDPTRERLVVTDLRRTPMPLVRFDTGDIVERDPSAPGNPITRFMGREVDSLVLPNGDSVSPYRVTLALEEIEQVRQYRVIQHADLSIHAEVWTDSGSATEVLEMVRVCLRVLTGELLQISITQGVDTSGASERKFRPVQSAAWSNR